MARRVMFLLSFCLLTLPAISAAGSVRVGYPSLATGFAASWVTAEKGIWKKHGLDVELIFLRGGGRTVAAIVGGSVDVILGSDLDLAALDFPQAKKWTERDNTDLSLIEEIQKSGFIDQLYK